jgi:thioester reductase-like protein
MRCKGGIAPVSPGLVDQVIEHHPFADLLERTLRVTRPELAHRIVVHCAATVNLFAPYAALRASNVLAARAVLEFATHGSPTAVHFLSPSASSFRHSTGVARSSSQSKWVADSMMTRARRRGGGVTVPASAITGDHRPVSVIVSTV